MLDCFISAAAGVNLSKIKQILDDKNLKVIHPSEIPSYGQSISENIFKRISQADVFIAVFDESFDNRNTLFELGMAVARKKQIIILIPPGYQLPSDLTGFLILKVTPDTVDALGFTVDQLLAAPIEKKRKLERESWHVSRPSSNRIVSKPSSNKIFELRNRLNSLDPKAADNKLEEFVTDLFKESGISIIQESSKPDMGIDFAIWYEDLEAFLGNPILVEIKKNISDHSQAQQVTNQLLNYMKGSNSKYALVLYLEGLPSNQIQQTVKPFNILFFKLVDIVDQLQDRSFADTVKFRRNIIAHGGDI